MKIASWHEGSILGGYPTTLRHAWARAPSIYRMVSSSSTSFRMASLSSTWCTHLEPLHWLQALLLYWTMR